VYLSARSAFNQLSRTSPTPPVLTPKTPASTIMKKIPSWKKSLLKKSLLFLKEVMIPSRKTIRLKRQGW